MDKENIKGYICEYFEIHSSRYPIRMIKYVLMRILKKDELLTDEEMKEHWDQNFDAHLVNAMDELKIYFEGSELYQLTESEN